MKRCTILFSVLMLTFTFVACKKDKDDSPANPTGFWTGLYGSGATVPNQPYSMHFKSDGTVRIYSLSTDTTSAAKADGTYLINNQSVTTNYTYISGSISGTFSTTATVNDAETEMSGTYGSGSNTTGGGTFTLIKQ